MLAVQVGWLTETALRLTAMGELPLPVAASDEEEEEEEEENDEE